MSKRSVAQKIPPKQSQPPESPPEPKPTKMEMAEYSVSFVDFDLCQDKNLVHVLVGARKLSRALRLAIGGLHDESEHSDPTEEDFLLLGEMASALSWLCEQARDLTAEAQPAPAKAA